MEQYKKSLNSETQIELLCSIFANHLFQFQRVVHFFINFKNICTIGSAKWRTTKYFGSLEAIEQCTKSCKSYS